MSEDKGELVGVEVGPRDIPYLRELRADLLPPDSRGVYIEKRKYTAKDTKKFIDRHLPHGNDLALQSDGSKIPLSGNSAKVVFAKDLFGAMGHPYLMGRGGLSDQLESVDSQSIAKEWFRVLENNGKAVIWETVTPHDRGALKKAFLEAGFKIREENEGDSSAKILDVYSIKAPPHGTYEPKSYSLVFEKEQ